MYYRLISLQTDFFPWFSMVFYPNVLGLWRTWAAAQAAPPSLPEPASVPEKAAAAVWKVQDQAERVWSWRSVSIRWQANGGTKKLMLMFIPKDGYKVVELVCLKMEVFDCWRSCFPYLLRVAFLKRDSLYRNTALWFLSNQKEFRTREVCLFKHIWSSPSLSCGRVLHLWGMKWYELTCLKHIDDPLFQQKNHKRKQELEVLTFCRNRLLRWCIRRLYLPVAFRTASQLPHL